MKKGLLVLLGAIAIASALLASNRAGAASVPAGFQDSVVFSGLSEPTALRFASDGRIFVAEKSGLIKVFDNLNDTTPTIFADLATNVYNFWDRGLLGLALDPQLPEPSLRLRPLHVRRRHRRHCTALGNAGTRLRSMPDATRARRATAASSAGGSPG